MTREQKAREIKEQRAVAKDRRKVVVGELKSYARIIRLSEMALTKFRRELKQIDASLAGW